MPFGCILFLTSDSSPSCQVTRIDRYQLCQCKCNLNHEDILFVRFNVVAPSFLPSPCLWTQHPATACSYTGSTLELAAFCWIYKVCLIYKCTLQESHAILSSAITLHGRDDITGLIEGRLIFLMSMIHFPLGSWKQLAVRVKWTVCNEKMYSMFLIFFIFHLFSGVLGFTHFYINKCAFD